jgi:TAG lipase/steryl ester hydrolase/phospholipase A2/LPA acyltransferase
VQRKLKTLIGNYTFLEAYERTGRILNVSVCPADTNEPARLLNYLTAPQVSRSRRGQQGALI